MDKLFLLDAYALIYRAYYAFIKSPRINSKGFNTSAVLGFVNTLHSTLPDLLSATRHTNNTRLSAKKRPKQSVCPYLS